VNEDREKLASWMMANDFATGHGDTIDDLLIELGGQIAEIREERDAMRCLLRAEQMTVDSLLAGIKRTESMLQASQKANDKTLDILTGSKESVS
jgi:hypothetical protein